ncbi:hypothetical protein H8M03_00315 [Sphingomonas sabuli]|uniref:Uncharacterized protein n=1 Tax=Sphingomonas sabuli TaxID=2764186 RepID=A0A7G9L2K7_9SPHN|nr:hypothetical protein [Sphingomonas sabuli]QNM82856.1 hypothetical protein H8M03_00315 [Sphingomonas sabuli]
MEPCDIEAAGFARQPLFYPERKPIMRLGPIALLALLLTACGSDGPAGNNAAVTEETDAGDIAPVNDSTAIDAATGEAANMAADVNYSFDEIDNESGNAADNAAENAAD